MIKCSKWHLQLYGSIYFVGMCRNVCHVVIPFSTSEISWCVLWKKLFRFFLKWTVCLSFVQLMYRELQHEICDTQLRVVTRSNSRIFIYFTFIITKRVKQIKNNWIVECFSSLFRAANECFSLLLVMRPRRRNAPLILDEVELVEREAEDSDEPLIQVQTIFFLL